MAKTRPPLVRLADLTPGQAGDFFVLLVEKTRGAKKDGQGCPRCHALGSEAKSEIARAEHVLSAAIADLSAGRMILVVDDAAQPRQGEVCVAAQLTTPEHIGFHDAITPSALYLRETERLEIGLVGLSPAARHPDQLEATRGARRLPRGAAQASAAQ